MVGASAVVASVIALAAGATLELAVTTNADRHGFNLNTVGVILLVVGAVGAALSLITMLLGSDRGRRTVGNGGRVAHRTHSYAEKMLLRSTN